MVVFGHLFGIRGILYAGPFADGLAFLMAVIILTLEVKNLGNKKAESQSLLDDNTINNVLDEQIVITVSREYGSGGKYIGEEVAQKAINKLNQNQTEEKKQNVRLEENKEETENGVVQEKGKRGRPRREA